MNSKPLLVFDLDGTLWDSAANVAVSWNKVLQEEFREYPAVRDIPAFDADTIHSVMGLTMSEIAQKLMPEMEEELRRIVFTRCETYEVEYLSRSGGILYPLVRETLGELSERGYLSAIVSNCQTGYIDAFLTSMDMGRYFADTEEWGNTHLSKGQNIRLVAKRLTERCRIDTNEIYYIGDTQKDADGAEEAGAAFVFASYGFGNVVSYAHRIERFSDLLDIFR